MLAAATILAFAASKPAAPVSDVVKLRIKLIDLYCSTDPPSPVHSTASERAAAAKRIPCQLLAYRHTLEQTGADKKKLMEAKSRGFPPAQMRIDRKAMYSAVCSKVCYFHLAHTGRRT
jgi:hypothetical protein